MATMTINKSFSIKNSWDNAKMAILRGGDKVIKMSLSGKRSEGQGAAWECIKMVAKGEQSIYMEVIKSVKWMAK